LERASGVRTADFHGVGDPELLGAPVEDGDVVRGQVTRLADAVGVCHYARADCRQERHKVEKVHETLEIACRGGGRLCA
jgi:hypothetical protein